MEPSVAEPPMAIDRRVNRVRNADDEEPVFDDTVEHNVVKRCQNGVVKGRSTAPIYVIVRIHLAGEDTDADILGYSYSPQYGCSFMEAVAAKDAFGTTWDYKHGSPCFDPVTDDGSLRAFPQGRFIMWDEPEEPCDGIPSATVGSITVYEADKGMEQRETIRRYKFMQAQPTLNDFLAIETEGDRKFIQ